VQKQNVMAINNVKTELPKVIGTGAIVDASTLATGQLTLANGGNDLIDIKVSDIVNWSYAAYTAGTPEVTTVDLSAASLIANNLYSMTVKLPNVAPFYGGHATSEPRQSEAIYVTRTYTVSTDATPTALELAAAFVSEMNADLYAPFTAVDLGGGVIELTACDATAGAFILNFSNIPGAVEAVITPNVLPVGEPNDVKRYVLPSEVTAASYDRHYLTYRKYVRHNAVKGLEVVKEETLIIFSDTADALNAALGPILDGTYTPVADYLGAPSV
jgi:hypothetical protein